MTHQSNRSSLGLALGKTRQRGFSLLEIALVLVIVGFALGGIVSALGPQLENKKVSDTQDRIKQASEAIVAFAMVNRRLPCPATMTSNGFESFCTTASGACGAEVLPPAVSVGSTNGRCRGGLAPNAGFVPARALGLGEQSPNGLMQDPWAFGLRYAVDQRVYSGTGNAPTSKDCSVVPCYPFTQVNGLKNAFYDSTGTPIIGFPLAPPAVPAVSGIPIGVLKVCATATGITGIDCGPAANLLASAAFIVWSTGRNGAQLPGGSGVDEAANLNNDAVYVFHPRADSGVANGAFDDILNWQTTNLIGSNMIKAGVLP